MALYINESQEYFYEIATECRIDGELFYVYDNNKINFRQLTFYKDSNGLYRYLITITPNVDKVSKLQNIDVLLGLLSVYLGCRFFKLSCYNGPCKVKTLFPFLYQKCPKEFMPTIFGSSNIQPFQRTRFFDEELGNFLDRVNNLENVLREKFIKSSTLYLSALQHVGLNVYNYSYNGHGDHGRVITYLKLISAIEVLSSNNNEPTSTKLDELLDNLFDKIYIALVDENLDHSQVGFKTKLDAIKQDYKNKTKEASYNKINQVFKKFIKENSKNYKGIKQTQHGQRKNKNIYVYKQNLDNVLHKIYDARSRYLHDGIPLVFSNIMHNSKYDWHFSANILDKKLPYEWWFEGLVRYCIQEYLIKCTVKE